MTFPAWLHSLSIVSLVVAGLCAIVIAVDETRRPQKMAVMAVVWPLTALFGGVLWLWAYWSTGRGRPRGEEGDAPETPMAAAVLKGASHCGAGCTLGDIIAEWFAFAVPGVATLLGYGTLFGERMFAVWVADFIVAYLLGIAFQYWAIKPMGDLSPGQALGRALKADTASITSWQVGMYGMMALLQLAWLRPSYGHLAPVDSPEFWFIMQIAMLAGFAVAYPVNWWLVQSGVKEKM